MCKRGGDKWDRICIGATGDSVRKNLHSGLELQNFKVKWAGLQTKYLTPTITRLGAGLNVTTEVKTGKRQVIEFLLSPIKDHLSSSIGER
jgi:hypothetical protein